MPSAIPARKVAGNKTGPVRRQRAARPKEPKAAREEYTDALRARCRKDCLVRKPADLDHSPDCNEPGKVVTRVAYTPKYAAKWFYKVGRSLTSL